MTFRREEVTEYYFAMKGGWFSTTVTIPREGATEEKALETLLSEDFIGNKNPDDWTLLSTYEHTKFHHNYKQAPPGEGCPNCGVESRAIKKLFGDAWTCDNCGCILKK